MKKGIVTPLSDTIGQQDIFDTNIETMSNSGKQSYFISSFNLIIIPSCTMPMYVVVCVASIHSKVVSFLILSLTLSLPSLPN